MMSKFLRLLSKELKKLEKYSFGDLKTIATWINGPARHTIVCSRQGNRISKTMTVSNFPMVTPGFIFFHTGTQTHNSLKNWILS